MVSARAGLRLARHRGTTANLCTLYPFHTGPGPGRAGPYLGVHVTGGGAAWHYDPFELYPHVLTDSNILIAGRPGRGKSTAVKTFLYRELAVYGRRRFVSISDPKGEYGPLADALGLTVIKLHPGGTARLNVLDAAPGGTEDDLLARQRLLVAMLAAVLGRPLDGPEESLITRAIEHLARTRLTFDICDLARVAHDPPDALISDHVELASLNRRELRDAERPTGFALGKLIDRTLRGMFDGPTNIDIDWEHGPGVVLDLSAVFGDREALPLVMMAATSWLQSAMTALHTQRRGLLVDDEVWAILENEWAVKHLRDRVKLCRARGIANILVCHKLSDLRAQADDGTTAAKVATALLADMQTRIVFQQAPDQIPEAQDLLGLSDVEARLLPRLVKGRALWRVADRAAIVQHVVGEAELAITDTDAAMTA
jgi:type IV secretory pathway VirB4 component